MYFLFCVHFLLQFAFCICFRPGSAHNPASYSISLNRNKRQSEKPKVALTLNVECSAELLIIFRQTNKSSYFSSVLWILFGFHLRGEVATAAADSLKKTAQTLKALGKS